MGKWDQTMISNKVYGFSSVTCHVILYGLMKKKEKGETFLTFLSTQLAKLPLCAFPSLASSLPSVPHSPLPFIFASHSSFYSLVHWLSFYLRVFSHALFLGSLLLFFFQLSLWKPQKLHATLIPSRMLLWWIVDQPTFSHVLNLFLTATIREKGHSLSFCGC